MQKAQIPSHEKAFRRLFRARVLSQIVDLRQHPFLSIFDYFCAFLPLSNAGLIA